MQQESQVNSFLQVEGELEATHCVKNVSITAIYHGIQWYSTYIWLFTFSLVMHFIPVLCYIAILWYIPCCGIYYIVIVYNLFKYSIEHLNPSWKVMFFQEAQTAGGGWGCYPLRKCRHSDAEEPEGAEGQGTTLVGPWNRIPMMMVMPCPCLQMN